MPSYRFMEHLQALWQALQVDYMAWFCVDSQPVRTVYTLSMARAVVAHHSIISKTTIVKFLLILSITHRICCHAVAMEEVKALLESFHPTNFSFRII